MRVRVREVCSSGYSCMSPKRLGDMMAGQRKRRKSEALISLSAMSSPTPLCTAQSPRCKHLLQLPREHAEGKGWGDRERGKERETGTEPQRPSASREHAEGGGRR